MRLDFIRPLYERREPYASVYLTGLNDAERERRWRSLREQLHEADPGTLEALEKEVAVPAAARALFAASGEVVLAEELPRGRELAQWSPLPLVTPMLMERGENVPHIRVIVDHAGAEVTVFGGGSPRRSTVEAAAWPLQKTAQGGWSQKRYERGVEEAWERNAAAAAQEIDEQVHRIGAELVIVAGEPKSRSLLCDHLGTKTADRVLMVEHGSRDDHGGFERDAETALDGWLERRRAELIERYREAEGPTGLAEVAHALREGRAHAVLLPGELADPVWIGQGGTQLASSADDLRRWGVEQPVRERADSALARAAAMTDAELWFCPELSDVCAVIRW
ncbi:Vms1/Ankzf1 family peptidyl-tRNA hydrolase [Thermoactinospora rubra]|uniref:baeRF2 domain-containing protein n=1 Tax=Thermoactinospora rubra TaxID=1088767 RepID=UPI000A11F671|nr:Vms1/Ankzf1 family peptidyl-tRNA hydrolase [Thermoactinospora rubra]